MSTEKLTTHSSKETQKLGVELAKQILQRKPKNHAIVLALSGDLGAGKTTFIQGFAKGLGIKEKILSPTFILMKKFQIPKTIIPKNQRPSDLGYKYFFHFDCYRLNNAREILELGFREIILNSENIVAIEWAEKLGDLLSKNAITIKFDHLAESKRGLTISR